MGNAEACGARPCADRGMICNPWDRRGSYISRPTLQECVVGVYGATGKVGGMVIEEIKSRGLVLHVAGREYDEMRIMVSQPIHRPVNAGCAGATARKRAVQQFRAHRLSRRVPCCSGRFSLHCVTGMQLFCSQCMCVINCVGFVEDSGAATATPLLDACIKAHHFGASDGIYDCPARPDTVNHIASAHSIRMNLCPLFSCDPPDPIDQHGSPHPDFQAKCHYVDVACNAAWVEHLLNDDEPAAVSVHTSTLFFFSVCRGCSQGGCRHCSCGVCVT